MAAIAAPQRLTRAGKLGRPVGAEMPPAAPSAGREAMQTMPSAQLVTAEVLGDRVRADSDAPVPWWSFAKTVLAVAALVLVAERRLRLDQRLP
ncbi:MAG: hypothetical protein J0H35_03710, partial [Rhodospirillales bacterium]|nr:hypothetical protein [Rhodospirillales bacterium]